MKNNNKALETIYNELNAGAVYGRDITQYASGKKPRFPYFDANLYITPAGFIGWTHYGSSANKNTIHDLEWILENIFETTPEEFLKKYITRKESKIYY